MRRYHGWKKDIEDRIAGLDEWAADRAHRRLSEWERRWLEGERAEIAAALEGARVPNPVPYPVPSGNVGNVEAAAKWVAMGGGFGY